MKHSWKTYFDSDQLSCEQCGTAVSGEYWIGAHKVLKQEECSGKKVVTNLPHYTTGGVEAIDAIEAWELNFRLANVVKYIARCGKKPGVETVDDLRKARAYLSREIAALEGRKAWG